MFVNNYFTIYIKFPLTYVKESAKINLGWYPVKTRVINPMNTSASGFGRIFRIDGTKVNQNIVIRLGVGSYPGTHSG